MTDKVEFVLEAQDQGATRAWQAIARSVVDYQRELGKIDDLEKKNESAAAAHGRAAQRVLEDLKTPQERYNRQLAHLDELRKKNLLTELQYGAAVRKNSTDFLASTSASESGINKLITRVGGLAAGYFGVSAAVGHFTQANKEAIAEAEAAATKFDTMFRRFNVMAGLRGIEGKDAKLRILKSAEKFGFRSEEAEAGATALASSGFSAPEASGPALDALLKLQGAQTLYNKEASPGDIAASFSGFLSANNIDLTGQNVEKYGVALQSLKETPINVRDLGQLSKVSGALKGAMSPEEQLANFAQLRAKGVQAEESGKVLRETVQNLSIAGTMKDRTKALKDIGLKPTDVDFQDESFEQVMGRIQKGLQKVRPEKRDDIIATLVEKSNVSGFTALMEGQGPVQELIAGMGDKAGYEKDVEEASGGIARAKTRQEVAREVRAAERDQNAGLMRGEIRAVMEERGAKPSIVSSAEKAFDWAQFFGASPETAGRISNVAIQAPSIFGAGREGDIYQEAQRRVKERLAPAAEQGLPAAQPANRLVEVMEENNKLLEANSMKVEENTKQLQNANGKGSQPNSRPAPPPVLKQREGGR